MSTASRPVTQLYRLLRLALPLSILWMTACTAENPDADVDDDEEVDMGDEEDDPDGSADGSTDVPDMSGGDLNLAIAAECQKLSVAVCDRLAACSKYYLRTYYGDLATCQSRVRLTCDPYVKLTGSSWTVERLRSCTMGYAGGTCDDYFAPGGPAACRPQPGQLANSAVCANSNQCKSANCAVGTGGCGTCTTVGKLGEACSAAQPCDLGLSCASGKCAAEGGAGAACGTGRAACKGGYYCKTASCTPQLAAGATCDPMAAVTECDPRQGLYCDTTTRKCVATAVANSGEACGTVGGVTTVCAAGGTCSGTAPNRTCLAAAKEGAACGNAASNYAACMSPAYCGTNQCRVFDPATCK